LKFEKGEQTDLKKFEDILAQCIDDIKAGTASIEECLDRYPSDREQLEPLLRLALEIREPPDVKPSPSFKVNARVWLMDQIHGGQAVTKWPWSRYDNQVKPMPLRRRFSMASIILVIVLALSALGGGTAYASQDSLPGDTLYPVKLATEQVRVMLPGDDIVKAERALSFAERRVGEIEALAERGRPQDISLGVQGYDDALNTTLARIERAGNWGLVTGNITARVAEATTRHLSVLDDVWDMVPDEVKTAIAHARNVSQKGYFHALAAVAKNNTVRAAEMNLAAMEGRLNRVRARIQDGEAMQIALQQFEAMAEFNEEISQVAQEMGLNITEVEELIAEATGKHFEVLADVWERVPEQAKLSIERAMANLMIRHQRRVQKLEQEGVEVPPSLVIPERVRERVEERIQEQKMEGTPGGTTFLTPGIPVGACYQYSSATH
jgi:hypothetical protein